jgi:hypothetical protein
MSGYQERAQCGILIHCVTHQSIARNDENCNTHIRLENAHDSTVEKGCSDPAQLVSTRISMNSCRTWSCSQVFDYSFGHRGGNIVKAADINVAQKEGFASRRVMQELKDGIASVLLVQTGLDALRLCLERRSKGIYEIGIHDVTQHRREEHKHTEHRTQNSPLQHEDTRTRGHKGRHYLRSCSLLRRHWKKPPSLPEESGTTEKDDRDINIGYILEVQSKTFGCEATFDRRRSMKSPSIGRPTSSLEEHSFR